MLKLSEQFAPGEELQPVVLARELAPAPFFAPAANRRFLFVTAPFGPFSSELARALRKAGAQCRRVLLNGGDLCEWGLHEATLYTGSREDWRRWIGRHLTSAGVTDLITHGDSHRYATEAIAVARDLGVNVHVFEQGYFRPHWITLERDGVNAHSRLPRHPGHYRQVGLGASLPQPTPVGRITPTAVRRIVSHQLASYLLWPVFPRFGNPYAYDAFRQGLGHVGRYIRQKVFKRQNRLELEGIFDGSEPVFLALLQRPGDSQITRHSNFAKMSGFIDHVVESFAKNAPSGARLLFKSHPLDHGIEPHARVVGDASERAGVPGRVFFADDGHFPTLIAKAAGLITVNSTGGLSAVEAGLPTVVLGEAIYNMPGLTHQTGLDAFWCSPEQPEATLFSIYQTVVMASSQINGAFSTRHGISLAVPEAARRLLNAQPIQ